MRKFARARRGICFFSLAPGREGLGHPLYLGLLLLFHAQLNHTTRKADQVSLTGLFSCLLTTLLNTQFFAYCKPLLRIAWIIFLPVWEIPEFNINGKLIGENLANHLAVFC